MRFILIIAALGLAPACGARQQPAPVPDLERTSSSQLASEELCLQAVERYEQNEFQSTTTPVRQKGLFNRTAHEWRHRDRVRHCQTSFSEREAACIATAPSLQYVANCRRFAELQ
jgi:hypothetical protein